MPPLAAGTTRLGGTFTVEKAYKIQPVLGWVGATNTMLGLTFSLSDLGDVTNMVNLFDEYTVNRFTVLVAPTFSSVDINGNAGATTFLNRLTHLVVDYNSDVVGGYTEDNFLQYSDITSRPTFTKPWSVSIRPRICTTTDNVDLAGAWVSTANFTGKWYGFKIMIPQTNAPNSYEIMNLYASVNITFRRSR